MATGTATRSTRCSGAYLSSNAQNQPLIRAGRALKALQSRLTNLQTPRRSRAVAEEHYDIDHRMYALFLGPWNQYTCCFFDGTNDLDRAEVIKLEMLCDKLELKAGRPAARHRLWLGRVCEVRRGDPRLRGHRDQPLGPADQLRHRVHARAPGHDQEARLPRPARLRAPALRQDLDRRHDRARRLQELRGTFQRRAPDAEAPTGYSCCTRSATAKKRRSPMPGSRNTSSAIRWCPR